MQFKQASSARSSLRAFQVARLALVALGAALFLSPARADTALPLDSAADMSMLSDASLSWRRLPNSMVRVVYLRDVSAAGRTSSATRVYINGRFHTGLQAGNYTVFCLPAGLHTLSSLDNPADSYESSVNLTPAQMLLGGNTYVVHAANTLPLQHASELTLRAIDVSAVRYGLNRSQLLSRAQTLSCPVQQALAQP